MVQVLADRGSRASILRLCQCTLHASDGAGRSNDSLCFGAEPLLSGYKRLDSLAGRFRIDDRFGTEPAKVPATGAWPKPEPQRSRWPTSHAAAICLLGHHKVLAKSRGSVRPRERDGLAVCSIGVGSTHAGAVWTVDDRVTRRVACLRSGRTDRRSVVGDRWVEAKRHGTAEMEHAGPAGGSTGSNSSGTAWPW
jgi:hypothetical protein